MRATAILFALLSFAFLSTACTTENTARRDEPPLPSAADVTTHCLAQAAGNGKPLSTAGEMNVAQWRRYVSCALTSNMIVASNSTPGSPEAIVSLRINPDGSLASVALLNTSGSEAWDAAVQRAIVAASPLPPAPPTQHAARIDMHFKPQQRQLGM